MPAGRPAHDSSFPAWEASGPARVSPHYSGVCLFKHICGRLQIVQRSPATGPLGFPLCAVRSARSRSDREGKSTSGFCERFVPCLESRSLFALYYSASPLTLQRAASRRAPHTHAHKTQNECQFQENEMELSCARYTHHILHAYPTGYTHNTTYRQHIHHTHKYTRTYYKVAQH